MVDLNRVDTHFYVLDTYRPTRTVVLKVVGYARISRVKKVAAVCY